MSAFMMSNESLSMLAEFISRYYRTDGDAFAFYFPEELEKELGPFARNPEMVFHRLADLNVESLRRRYPEFYTEMTENIEFIPGCDIWREDVYDIENGVKFMREWHYQILKSFDCYLYQSCEGGCYKLPLYKAIQALRDKWGGYIAENHPLYESMEWK